MRLKNNANDFILRLTLNKLPSKVRISKRPSPGGRHSRVAWSSSSSSSSGRHVVRDGTRGASERVRGRRRDG